MSLKENNILIKYLGNLYLKMQIEYINTELNIEESGQITKAYSAIEFIHDVDEILKSLPPDYEIILRNDYFRHRERKWYLKYYSRSTYYRLKVDALNEFVRCVTN